MASQELEKRDLSELIANCKDLFEQYASVDPCCSITQKSAAQQQERFSTLTWAVFTDHDTSIDLDVIWSSMGKQLVAMRTNLEFAVLHDTEFNADLDVSVSPKDIQRQEWIQQLEGTTSEALEAVKCTIDRLFQLNEAMRQRLNNEGTTKKTAESKQVHISSKASAPSHQMVSSADTTTDMENDTDQKRTFSVSSSMNSSLINHNWSGFDSIHKEIMHISNRETVPSLESMINGGKALFHQGKYPEAEKKYRKAMGLHFVIIDVDLPSSISVKGNLANAIAKQGREDEAEVIYQNIRGLSDRINDEAHTQALACRSNYASILQKRGRHGEAVKILRHVLQVRKTVEPRGLDTLSSRNRLANALVRTGKFDEAMTIYKESLLAHEEELTEEDPKTIITLGNLVNALQNQGRSEEAKKQYLKRLELGLGYLHSEHPCRNWISARYEALKDSD
ncbi:uncharacterized protein B0J16DRAFT_386553 [Fusarium flagelliforme]|uniref:uncharacterized protein n=1 Tax=Fusarium flagelliforme TaxID=2675880 RepID=UPI001E8CCD70|nr:uncharacterized protein B0J16DRAFT_386553 [Fusarium flagelliforme]KAH7183486.1 hypothetical protein B0J16DRAFT_386553 [Fusarium flagelliforme]